MRTKRTLLNMAYALGSSLLLLLLGLVTRRLLVDNFGPQITTASQVVSQLFNFFSIAEFGVGSVISYRLYEQIAAKNEEKISKYMSMYKWAYRAVGSVIALLALCGLFFACILGLVFGILSVLKNRACNIIATVFVDIIRGVPMIVLAFYVYFAVPMLLNNILHLNMMLGMKGQITFSALQAGTICLALNCGAYMAEIIRAGIESVDKGQMEAARSLGLPYWRAMYRVVLPQAIRTMIPSIINQFIITLKDTSILSVIGFPELVNTAKNVVANTMSAFQVWTIVAVMYLVVITLLSRLAKKVERRLNRGRQ